MKPKFYYFSVELCALCVASENEEKNRKYLRSIKIALRNREVLNGNKNTDGNQCKALDR